MTDSLGVRRQPSRRGAAHSRNLAWAAMKRMYRIDVHNSDLVPRHGRVIVAGSQVAAVDGSVLFAATPRPLHMLSNSKLFVGALGSVMRSAGAIERNPAGADVVAFRQCVSVLERGGAIGMFPEPAPGSGTFQSIEHHIAYLQAHSNAPVVPAVILGTFPTSGNPENFPRLRSHIDVVFGEPVPSVMIGDIDFRATVASLAERLRQRLADHARHAATQLGYHNGTDGHDGL